MSRLSSEAGGAFRLRPQRFRERGQSLAEVAILLPVLMVIVMVATDVGRLYFAYVSVTNGARTGASYAALSASNSTNTTGIRNAVHQDTGNISPSPTVTSSTGTDSDGNTYARVTVTHNFDFFFSMPGLPGNVNLTRTVQMRVAP